MTTPVPPEGSGKEDRPALSPQAGCEAACETYLKMMRRPMRRHIFLLSIRLVALGIVSMLPLAFALFASVMAPLTPVPDATDALQEAEAAVTAAETRLEAAVRETAVPGSGPASVAALKQEAEARGAVEQAMREAAAGPAGTEQTAYAARLRLTAAIVVFVPLAVLALWAQSVLIRRNWSNMVGHLTLRGVRTNLPVIAATGVFVAAYLVLYWIEPWLLRPLFLGPDLGAAFNWTAGATALVTTLIFTTLFGTTTYAANYPTATQADRIKKLFDAAAGLGGGKDAVDVLKQVFPPGPKGSDVTILSRITSGAVKSLTGPIVDCGLTAEQSIKVIRGLCVALGVVMILGLFVLSMALDMLESGYPGPPAYRAALAASADMWVLFTGIGFSIVLFLAYGPPVARLTPFVSAATKPKASPEALPEWAVSGTAAPELVDLTLAKKKAEAIAGRYDIFDEIGGELGADAAKFLTIIEAGDHGGGFQQLVSDSLGSQLKSVLGILAPAIAGGVLSLIG